MTKNPQARTLERNIVRNNQFGLDGTDVNGVDIAYDGSGRATASRWTGVTSTFPPTARRSRAARARTPSAAHADAMLGWIGESA